MKKVVILLLILGIVFSAEFPQTIYGTALELNYLEGNTEQGYAVYTNSDETILVYVEAQSADDLVSDYSGWQAIEESGMNCYYTCNLDYDAEYGDYSYCMLDCYSSETLYYVDPLVVGGTTSDAFYEGLAVVKSIAQSNAGITSDDGYIDNGTNDEEYYHDAYETCPCASSLMLVLLVLAIAYRK